MDKKKKWTVKDVITTVLLSAVLIVIQLVVNMVCMANDFVSMVAVVGSPCSSARRSICSWSAESEAFCDTDLYDDPRVISC